MSRRGRNHMVLSQLCATVAMTSWVIAFGLSHQWMMLVGHVAVLVALLIWLLTILTVRITDV